MECMKPVIEGNEEFELIATDSTNVYDPLPVLEVDGAVMSRWTFTDEERKYIAEGGDLFICQLHFGHAIQPIMPLAKKPEEALKTFIEMAT
jgi:hypothetical protein